MYRNNLRSRNCDCRPHCSCEEEKVVKSIFEDTCQYVPNNILNTYNSCECGFDEESNLFPVNPMFGQSYVPWETMEKTFTPEKGLRMGTIFPELVSPYAPGDSEAFNDYVACTNIIGEGCNR